MLSQENSVQDQEKKSCIPMWAILAIAGGLVVTLIIVLVTCCGSKDPVNHGPSHGPKDPVDQLYKLHSECRALCQEVNELKTKITASTDADETKKLKEDLATKEAEMLTENEFYAKEAELLIAIFEKYQGDAKRTPKMIADLTKDMKAAEKTHGPVTIGAAELLDLGRDAKRAIPVYQLYKLHAEQRAFDTEIDELETKIAAATKPDEITKLKSDLAAKEAEKKRFGVDAKEKELEIAIFEKYQGDAKRTDKMIADLTKDMKAAEEKHGALNNLFYDAAAILDAGADNKADE